VLAERDKLNRDIQEILDRQTEAWGIKVTNVEIKDIDLNETIIRAIARQAEAERERRAKIINAEGERRRHRTWCIPCVLKRVGLLEGSAGDADFPAPMKE
jgi:regulator of protease activity HflC (stomatin/prohibitin superfamily)